MNQKPGGNSSIVLGSEKSQFEEKKYDSHAAPLKSKFIFDFECDIYWFYVV